MSYKNKVLDDKMEILRTTFPTNSTFLLVPHGEEPSPHSGYLWHCMDCSVEGRMTTGWTNRRGFVRGHSTEEQENHCLFPFNVETVATVRELKSGGVNGRELGISATWGRPNTVVSLSSLQIGVQGCREASSLPNTSWTKGTISTSNSSGTESISSLPTGRKISDEVVSTNVELHDLNLNVGSPHVRTESIQTRKRKVDYTKMCGEDNDISGEDSRSDVDFKPEEDEYPAEDLVEKEPTKKMRRVSDDRSLWKKESKAMQDTDGDDSDTEEKEKRIERKKLRHIRMEEEFKLGQEMIKEWEFHEDDELMRTKFRKEVWLKSDKSQQMNGSETGLTRTVVDKLEAGLQLSQEESLCGAAIKTVVTYEIGLRKVMNSYNRQKKEQFPGSSEVRLADFLAFKSKKQILPQHPEFLIEKESSPFVRCHMIQSHNVFLKMINKELQGGAAFARFLPRDPSNPAIPLQNYTAEDRERALESKDRFCLSVSSTLNSSKDLLSRTKRISDACTKRGKHDRERFLGKVLPDPHEVLLIFFKSQYVK